MTDAKHQLNNVQNIEGAYLVEDEKLFNSILGITRDEWSSWFRKPHDVIQQPIIKKVKIGSEEYLIAEAFTIENYSSISGGISDPSYFRTHKEMRRIALVDLNVDPKEIVDFVFSNALGCDQSEITMNKRRDHINAKDREFPYQTFYSHTDYIQNSLDIYNISEVLSNFTKKSKDAKKLFEKYILPHISDTNMNKIKALRTKKIKTGYSKESEMLSEEEQIEKYGYSLLFGAPYNGVVKDRPARGYHKTESYTVVNGLKQGKYTSTERGYLKYDVNTIEANYVDGQLHGPHIERNDDNNVKIFTTYKKGKKDGVSTTYDTYDAKNNFKKSEILYKNDKKIEETSFTKNGEVTEKTIYDKNGHPATIYDKDGNVIRKYKNGKDVSEQYKNLKKQAAKNVSSEKGTVTPKQSAAAKAMYVLKNSLTK